MLLRDRDRDHDHDRGRGSAGRRGRAHDPLVRALPLLELSAPRILGAVAAGVATLASALALAALSAWLITRAWQMPPVLDLSVAVVAVRALGISRGVFRYIERLATHDTALRGTTAIRETIYRRLADGKASASAGRGRGDLLARTGADVDDLGDVVVRALIPIAVAGVTATGAVGLIAVISPRAAAVLAVALAVSGIAAPWLAARSASTAERKGSQSRAAHSAAAVLALDHAAELRVAGRAAEALESAAAAHDEHARAVDSAARPSAWADAATPIAMGAAVLGSLFIGIDLFAHTALSPMSLAILVLFPLSAFEATSALPAAAVQLSRSRVAAGRIMALLDAAGAPGGDAGEDTVAAEGPAPREEDETRGGAQLAARALRCGWQGRSAVTLPSELIVRPGERVAIVGPSGVGKTTMLMTLAGLLPPVSGSITLDGRVVAAHGEDGLRRAMGFFPEDAHVFNTTVRENLRVVRGDASDHEMRVALAAAGAGSWLDGLPAGLDTALVGGAESVSGGQRRRLLLARALLSRAPVLLLDEPTEHLDSVTSASLQTALMDRSSGLVDETTSVVMVTHRLPVDTGADAVIEVVGGIARAVQPA